MQPGDGLLLGLPLRLHAHGALAQRRQLPGHVGATFLGCLVALLLERRELDLVLDGLALDLVDFLWQRIDLDAQPAGGLVHQIDRFVGQEAIPDVAMRQRRRRDDGVVGDPDAVMYLVALLETTQDRDRILDGRLADVHRLEPALQRGVFLDVLAILIERRGADDVQLAAGQRGLEQIRRVDRALGAARAHQGVELVDEHDEPAFGAGDLLDHRLEALLELAAILGPGDQLTQVERHEVLVLERLGDVAVDDPLGEALDDRRLPDARLADQHGIVLGATGKHLDHPADLFVPADDRIEFPRAGDLGQVAREPLQCLIFLLRLLVGHLVRTAHPLERREQVIPIDPRVGQQLPRRGALLLGQRQEQVLRGDVRVVEAFRLAVGAIDHVGQLAGQHRLGSGAGLLGEPFELALRFGAQLSGVQTDFLQQGNDDALFLRQQRMKEMGIVDHGVAPRARQRGGLLQRLRGLYRQAIRSNHSAPIAGNLRAQVRCRLGRR